MMENEDSCIYCSKSLMGLNNFNKRMHIETCKVRKIVDDNPNKSHLELDEIMVIGDNCSYCFKSFKDFKSEFNKRLHVKCCKIKKETNEEKQNMKCQTKGESCLFCTKPLENLNEFNKRMHVENCKIRKSLEGANGKKDTNGGHGGMNNSQSSDNGGHGSHGGGGGIDLGDNCGYCGKSFVNLSNFNKRLHFDHCKLKKKKLGVSLNSSGGSSQQQHQDSSMSMSNSLNMSNNSANSSSIHVAHTNGLSLVLGGNGGNINNNNNHQNNYANLSMGSITYDLGETCVFCSRSLKNLSNFNKRIHIETCKVKKFKIATSKMRQEARKQARKSSCGLKKEKESTIDL